MTDPTILEFAFSALVEMNYDVDGLDEDSVLGPAGADLESVALAELGIRVEERFGITFSDDEADRLTALTIGEFCGLIGARLAAGGMLGAHRS